MKLTRTDVVFSRTTMVLFIVQKTKVLRMTCKSTEITFGKYKNTGEIIKVRGPTLCPRGWGSRPLPLGAPLSRGPPAAPPTSTPTPYIPFHGKKIREKVSSRFTIRSRHQTQISLGRADLESVRAPERGIRRRRHHQPSSITNFMMLTTVRE